MFSDLFDDDQTFGIIPDSRAVVLRGTTTVSQLFSPNLFDIPGWIETALENNGFSVNAVRMSAAGYVGYSNNLEIELNVFNSFTSEQARQNAIQAIEAYTANWGLNKVFYNTTLSVASDAYVAPSGGNGSMNTGGGTRPPVTSPPSVYDQSSGQSPSQFLDNLGLGLGVSTPVVIGAAALLVVLMLKR